MRKLENAAHSHLHHHHIGYSARARYAASLCRAAPFIEFPDLAPMNLSERECALQVGCRRLLQHLGRGRDYRRVAAQHAHAAEEPAHPRYAC
jgi:hypothetical protein